MTRIDRKFEISDCRQEYLDLLSPLFLQHERVDTVEFVCALTRAGGTQDAGWDPLEESRAFVNDLASLIQADPAATNFSDPEVTRWRMALVAYGHLVEMDAPYDVLANLFRIRVGRRHSVQPFADGTKKSAKPWKPNSRPPPGPAMKLPKLRELAASCKMSAITDAFDSFYSAPLRNAISHSDFTLHGAHFRARKGYFPDSVERRVFTPFLELERLANILSRAFCFYAAFFELEFQARMVFRGLRGQTFQYDQRYKGVLELLFDEEMICGFTIHWPNGTDSTFSRRSEGCEATNVMFRDGCIEPMVGLYASNPGDYSPLVERGAAPTYQQTKNASEVTWDGARVPGNTSF
jgi:hypothetical protein